MSVRAPGSIPAAMRWAMIAGLLVFAPAFAETWRFAVIGDTPYNRFERAELPKMLKHITDHHVDFIAHVGDIKHGSVRCDDALFEDRYQLFDQVLAPFILVPGDNEWTDCHRLSNGSYDPLERLDKLRHLFWSNSQSLGQKRLTLERQPGDYPENSRFQLGPVLFVTLNLPGSNNNHGQTDRPNSEFLARNPMVIEWLKENFALAKRRKLPGIVLLFQANPDFKHFTQGIGHLGYREFIDVLRQESETFPGKVVVVHGDTHISRIDQPLRDMNGKTLANFVRVETFGFPTMGWTHGIIDLDDPALIRFTAHPWPMAAPQ